MLTTTKFGGLSLALAGTALALGTFAARPGDAAMSKDKRRAIMKAVPLLVTLVQKDGKILGIASFGSGTTMTPRGHIFTANHVIDFSHPLPDGITVVPEMYVFVTPDNNADPIPVCTFNPHHMPHDPVLDIAMVMCEHDLKGNAWDPGALSWPVVGMGDPASMTQGDDLWIFGYPGAGLDPRKKASELFVLPTMNVSEGKFAGVVNERDGDAGHHISWVKTDAEISGGNSGGCATDDDGNYLGAPTEVHTDVRDSKNGDGGTLGHVGFIRPTNLFKPYVDMAAKGWMPSDSPPDDPQPTSGEGVVVSGSVVSADTGEPLAGMVIVVFKEGVTARQIMSSKSPADLMLTRGESDAKGQFTIATKVPKGSYTVAVIGQGYKPLIDDDALVIDGKTPPKYRAWNKIAVTRCAPGASCLQ
jgi:S1-C subfamily serine protease